LLVLNRFAQNKIQFQMCIKQHFETSCLFSVASRFDDCWYLDHRFRNRLFVGEV